MPVATERQTITIQFMSEPEEKLLRDFVAWCKRRTVSSGSELADLQARAEALLPKPKPERKNPLDRFTFWEEKWRV